jgi:hypothetical protein
MHDNTYTEKVSGYLQLVPCLSYCLPCFARCSIIISKCPEAVIRDHTVDSCRLPQQDRLSLKIPHA